MDSFTKNLRLAGTKPPNIIRDSERLDDATCWYDRYSGVSEDGTLVGHKAYSFTPTNTHQSIVYTPLPVQDDGVTRYHYFDAAPSPSKVFISAIVARDSGAAQDITAGIAFVGASASAQTQAIAAFVDSSTDTLLTETQGDIFTLHESGIAILASKIYRIWMVVSWTSPTDGWYPNSYIEFGICHPNDSGTIAYTNDGVTVRGRATAVHAQFVDSYQTYFRTGNASRSELINHEQAV